jgi:S-adenosylmethionine:tRNA ribosyltransferase-isomerase
MRVDVLRTCELEYELPPEFIATSPATPRDSARMMVVERASVRHLQVRELAGLLRTGDCLVVNTTRVVPARFRARRVGTGGRVEGLYLSTAADGAWVVLLRGGHLREGVELEVLDREGQASGLVAALVKKQEPGAWVLRVGANPAEVLERVGETPLPPYIVKARGACAVDDRADRKRYQTVYADAAGSVAAPTAGLHFTPELLGDLAARGVQRVDVVLHVGAGTFKPVETEFVEDHPMHAEWCSMNAAAVETVTLARREGRRVIAVGTTAARTLEAYAAAVEAGPWPESIETRLLITPGYRFRWVDGLLTNFHLPGSTLMALVGAVLEARGFGGVARLRELYAEAIGERYRFYSFGDAMLIA